MLAVFRSKKAWILPFIPVLVDLFVFYFSSAHPIVYVLTICIYVPLMVLLLKMVNYKTALIVALLVTGTMAFSRLSPRQQNINPTDLTNLSFYQVTGGERIEQDFYLPKSDWRLTRLLDDSEVGTVLRIIGNISDEQTQLFVNGHEIGSVSQLVLSKSAPMYSIPNAYNYILRFPKNDITDNPIISLELISPTDYLLGYNSGFAPLPVIPHDKRSYPNGNWKDISSKYYHRRFRFSMVIYFVSNVYFSGGNDPLILGSIH